MQSRQVDNYTI